MWLMLILNRFQLSRKANVNHAISVIIKKWEKKSVFWDESLDSLAFDILFIFVITSRLCYTMYIMWIVVSNVLTFVMSLSVIYWLKLRKKTQINEI